MENNNKLKVFHYDDLDSGLDLIPNFLSYKANELGLEIIPTYFKNVDDALSHLKKHEFDLIILDLMEKDGEGEEITTGTRILEYLKTSNTNTNIFIYTSITRKKTTVNPKDFFCEKYPFIDGFFFKEVDYDEIGLGFRKFLEENELIPEIFTLKDKDDYNLISEINSFGQNEINTLLVRIKKYLKKDSGNYIIDRITSGLSGASIFMVEYELNGNKRRFLLKVSKDKDAIEKEYNNTEFYELLPHNFRLRYNTAIPKKELKTENSFAIVIEYAEKTSTLYDWLLSDVVRDDTTTIEKLLKDLFLENGLSGFYSSNKDNSREKYAYIFKKLDEKRISFIKKAIKDLSPIINKEDSALIDEDLIDQILFNNIYRTISYKQPNKNIVEKKLILSHGDFHSKNILVSSTNRPTIIDTGGFGYDYWCSDISRLIVSLFIDGFDINTYEFFSIKSQIDRFEIAKKIISGEEIKSEELPSMNNGFIYAINWLRKNAKQIHGDDFYCEWEFQLNLGLEFFKSSYKSIVLPPGKRVLALMSACEAIRKANDNLK